MTTITNHIPRITIRNLVLLTLLCGALSFLFLQLFGTMTAGIMAGVVLLTGVFYIYQQQHRLKGSLGLSEDLLTNIFNNSTDSMFLIDPETRLITDCNESAIHAFEAKDKSRLTGITINDLCKQKDALEIDAIQQQIIHKGGWTDEQECRTFGKGKFWGQFAAKSIKVSDDHLYLLRISNVTKLKETEASLASKNRILTREKEKLKEANEAIVVLLKEVHHRVKNNLQVITSLLRLQSSYIEDNQLREVFKESVNRVSSMALIHETLYQSENMASVAAREYFEQLIGNLKSAYGLGEHIKIITEVTDLSFGLDVMVPIGLVVNELVSNSLKHAFEQGEAGEIKIAIQQGKQYTLTYCDNGKGLPADYDLKAEKTFGSIIINSLVEQIDGEIVVVKKEKGMCYQITFEDDKRELERLEVKI